MSWMNFYMFSFLTLSRLCMRSHGAGNYVSFFSRISYIVWELLHIMLEHNSNDNDVDHGDDEEMNRKEPHAHTQNREATAKRTLAAVLIANILLKTHKYIKNTSNCSLSLSHSLIVLRQELGACL